MNAKKKSADTAAARQSRSPIVLNNTNGPRYIPFGGVSDGGVGVVDLERMKFSSGLNAPKNPEEFSIVSGLESYKSWVADGVLEELDDVSDVPTVGGADERIIEASSSKTSMEWWLANEARPSVKKKLKAKVAEMKRRPTPGDED